ncbi:MAG TPA: alanine racemase [Candidatus Deferrimicrobiaceae bacterium]
MARPTVAEIRLSALQKNFQALRDLLPRATGILGVVKANGYGHGAIPVARALEAAGARMLGIATVDEGVELRRAGIRIPLVVLGGVDPPQAGEAHAHGLSAVLFDRGQAGYLAREAGKAGRPFPVHVKVDTGMGRLGILPRQVSGVLQDLAAERGLRLEGWMTHLSSADGPAVSDRECTREQLRVFTEGLPAMRAAFGGNVAAHALNSAGILAYREEPFDMVRPGIALYGCSPLAEDAGITLRPAMRIVSKIVSLKELPDGHTVSYNRRYRCAGPRMVAVVPVGYADGYRRGLTGQARMSVSGRTAPVAGTVCMDHTVIDVTGIPGVGIGSPVEVMGESSLSACEIARLCGTIPYEILTQVGSRVPRVAVD